MIMGLEWQCPKCEKIIVSSSESQEQYNIQQHLEKHKRREKWKKEKRKSTKSSGE